MSADALTTGKKTRVLILGGGFGGLYAALHLDKTIATEPNIEVTLISRENFVLFTPMLHEVAAGDLEMTDIVSPLRQMLKHVSFIEADVEALIWRNGKSLSPTVCKDSRRSCLTIIFLSLWVRKPISSSCRVWKSAH